MAGNGRPKSEVHRLVVAGWRLNFFPTPVTEVTFPGSLFVAQ